MITPRGSFLRCTNGCKVAVAVEDIIHGSPKHVELKKLSYNFGTKEPSMSSFPPHLCKCGAPFSRDNNGQCELFINDQWE